MREHGFWHRIFILSWLFILGILFLMVAQIFTMQEILETLITHVGVALVIVFFLAITVDWWLKQAILHDVFRATIGHMLPPELRPEMEWVYRQDIIATKHWQRCKLEYQTDDLLNVYVKSKRTLKNISQSNVKLELGLGVDEWFHMGKPSEIIDFGWRTNEEVENEQNKFSLEKGEYDLHITPINVSLPPNGSIDIWCEYKEVKHINDEHYCTYIYATNNPQVDVEAPEDLKIIAAFTQHFQKKMLKAGRNTYNLTGTLLPGQPIIIRWWKTKDSKRWLQQGS